MRGRSMEPTLREGDLLLALWGARVRPGVVAVVQLPADASGTPRPVSVKRIVGVDPEARDRWWLESDNAREGVSSFEIGSLAPSDVVAVVTTRLWPSPGKVTVRHTP
ncbi:peptidase S24 [Knoellia sinensis KCTC 19936]|uniref:Peptidase S24 n=1 Tax=Knoellia sinensis KCTC 19936 TaxID=1385520 RepID=A0A0A0JH15_9MICO|nr:peptidase S24 [Knoellia sinensis KCTC 19936]